MKKRSLATMFSVLALAAVVGMTAWAQTSGGGQTGGTGGGGTGGGTTGGTGGSTGGVGTPGTGGITRPPTTGQPGQQTPQMPQFEMQRPLFFSGKVMTEDGTPPPDQAVIEMVCNGQPRPQGYTDSKGKFSFQLGQNQGMFADASYGSADNSGMGFPGGSTQGRSTMSGPSRGYSERDLMGCELRAVLAGWRSEPVQLSGRRLLDNPDVGTILLKRLTNVEGYTYSLTTAMAPKDAKKAYEKGLEQAKKKKLPEAQEQLAKAVELYPKYAVAWFELGRVQEAQTNPEGARKSYNEAIAADGKFVSPYVHLAGMEARDRKWEEVAQLTDKVTRLNPYSFPGMYFYNAVANYNLQKVDAAEKSAREAVKLDPQHKIPKASQLLGIILAQKKDYSGAVEQLKGYLAASPDAGDAENVRRQIADIERVLGASTAQPGVPNPPNNP